MRIFRHSRDGRLRHVIAHTEQVAGMRSTLRPLTIALIVLALGWLTYPISVSADPTRSTTIALSGSGRLLVSVNHETNSVSIFRVSGGGNTLEKLAEVPVGREPSCVAVRRDRDAYVTNSASGTVSVVRLAGRDRNTVIAEIPVGTEPRGCALTPQGRFLHVANHTEGSVSVIDTQSQTVVDTVQVGGNPTAIAIDDNELVLLPSSLPSSSLMVPAKGSMTGNGGLFMSTPQTTHPN